MLDRWNFDTGRPSNHFDSFAVALLTVFQVYEHYWLHCRAMVKRGLSRHAVSVCVCVCVSAMFLRSIKMNKDIFEFFSPSGSHAILVFPIPNGMAIFRRQLSLTGASNAGVVGRNLDYEPISGFSACSERCNRPGVVNTVAGGPRPPSRN